MLSKRELRKKVKLLHGFDKKPPVPKQKRGTMEKKSHYEEGYEAICATLGLSKEAAISRDDIARAIAGMGADREITPEEITQFAADVGRESGRSGAIGGGIGGGIMGALGGAAIAGKRPLLGALGGLAAGGGLFGGLGYLLGRRSGKQMGTHLGQVAQAGKLPASTPYPAETYLPFTEAEWPEQSAPMSPEDYDAMRRQMAQEAMIQGGLEGVGYGGLSSLSHSDDDNEGTLSQLMRPVAHGALGAASARSSASRNAQQIQDLYRKGYGDLAGRIREESGY